MTPLSPLQSFAAGTAVAYGVTAAVGGVLGFLRAGSKASLFAGGLSGCLLIACGAFVRSRPMLLLGLVSFMTLLLMFRFGSVLVQQRAALSPVMHRTACVMVVGGLVTIVAAVAAIITAPSN